MRRRARRPTLSMMLLLLLLLVAGCGRTEVAEDTLFIPDISPVAIVELPEGIEEATIDISRGGFRVTELVLQEDEPTVLHVANADDQTYRLRIVEGLVSATEIAADATTDIQFTTPNAAAYEGQLLAADGDQVLDTFRVAVIGPGAVEP